MSCCVLCRAGHFTLTISFNVINIVHHCHTFTKKEINYSRGDCPLPCCVQRQPGQPVMIWEEWVSSQLATATTFTVTRNSVHRVKSNPSRSVWCFFPPRHHNLVPMLKHWHLRFLFPLFPSQSCAREHFDFKSWKKELMRWNVKCAIRSLGDVETEKKWYCLKYIFLFEFRSQLFRKDKYSRHETLSWRLDLRSNWFYILVHTTLSKGHLHYGSLYLMGFELATN